MDLDTKKIIPNPQDCKKEIFLYFLIVRTSINTKNENPGYQR
jgi:hypothetical protein